MKTEYLKNIIKEEFISLLKENAIPCGKCGQACPCNKKCANPTPTGFIVNGKPIQIESILQMATIKQLFPGGESFVSPGPKLDAKDNCGCNCNVEADSTPKMPDNQVTQFGNTTPFADTTADMDVPGHELPKYSTMSDIPTDRNEKLKQILNTLRGKPKVAGVFNGKPVQLNHPVSSDTHITFYVEKEGIVKEYKLKKNKK